MTRKIKLTFLIPAYNEGLVIKENLSKILKYLFKQNYRWEVLVIDDGSKDTTLSIVKKFKSCGVRLTSFKKNRGKGAALKVGVMMARGELIIFSDADLSVSEENIDKFLHELKKEDVVIGSRRAMGSKIEVHQPWFRENMGRVFTLIARIMTNSKISDFTCGFKGFRANAAKKIFGKSQIERWSYDVEILYLAKKLGYSIKEIPVFWSNRRDTKVVLTSDTLTSFRDLLRVRLNDYLGKYD